MSRKLWVLLTLRTTVDRAQARPVALVLGAGLRSDGRPTLLLARRLDIAADLYHRGTVDAVLVSGADEEPVAMRTYLRAAPTQEAAAEVLDLPLSTYRRYLAKALEQLTDLLWTVEIGGLHLPTKPRSEGLWI